jgi:DNA-binding CsgD family transcriptional regulator
MARDRDIIRLARLGRMTDRQIANRLDVSAKVVQRVRAANGLGRNRHPLTDEQRARAQSLLADGASQAEVARSVGCSKEQIRRAFPGQCWTTEQQVLAAHDTGVRAHTSPVLGARRAAEKPPVFVDVSQELIDRART